MKKSLICFVVLLAAFAWANPAWAQQQGNLAETAPTEEDAPQDIQAIAGQGRGFFLETRLEYAQFLNGVGLDMGVRLPRGGSGFAGGFPVNSGSRVQGEVVAGFAVNLGPVREIFALYQPDVAMGDVGGGYPLSFQPIVNVTHVGAGITLPKGWRVYAIHNLAHVLHEGAVGEPEGGLNNFVFVRSPELIREHGWARSTFRFEGGIAPFHNEYAAGIIHQPCADVSCYGDNFGRYWLKFDSRLEREQDFWVFEKFFAIARLEAVLGRTVPQADYTMSAAPIGEEFTFGAGAVFRGGTAVRLERSFWVLNRKEEGMVGVGPHGPYWAVVLSPPAFNWRQ